MLGVHFFGLLHHGSSAPSTPTGPNLNPYNETILSFTSDVTGSAATYLPSLEHQELCPASECPGLPQMFLNWTPIVIGLAFYFNVTNQAANDTHVSLPTLGISGTNPTVFYLITLCCYTNTNQKYDEALAGTFTLLPFGSAGDRVGLKAMVYSEVVIPQNAAGGYALYFNVTAT